EPRVIGDYKGKIEVRFKNRAVSNLVYAVTGEFVGATGFSASTAVFVPTEKKAKESQSSKRLALTFIGGRTECKAQLE
ncbi:MAG: hypothetical protein JWM68_2415, partial [Verrucomicrobiales bacterium]|nr:hypothetical protein [Verrucomicrobiales bacterium]